MLFGVGGGDNNSDSEAHCGFLLIGLSPDPGYRVQREIKHTKKYKQGTQEINKGIFVISRLLREPVDPPTPPVSDT